jgi:hypothetical protein
MGYKYRTGDRTYGGSMEPRLNPAFGGERLDGGHPSRPSPLVRATSGGNAVRENGNSQRRRLIGLPARFDREKFDG